MMAGEALSSITGCTRASRTRGWECAYFRSTGYLRFWTTSR